MFSKDRILIISNASGPVQLLQDLDWFSRTVQGFSSGWVFKDRSSGSDKGSGFSGRIGLVVSVDKEKKKLTDIGFVLEILMDIGKRTLYGFRIFSD